jgi:hypothetical protein
MWAFYNDLEAGFFVGHEPQKKSPLTIGGVELSYLIRLLEKCRRCEISYVTDFFGA